MRRILTAVLGMAVCAMAGFAAPPLKSEQVPGYFRAKIGTQVVTALYDGAVMINNSVFHDIAPATVETLLGERMLPPKAGVQTAVNAFLVHTGNRLILVDAGSAACFGPTAGHILDALKASGYTPADVDTILLTHMHPDHVCGLVDAAGKPVYPKASVWAEKADADFWLAPAKTDDMFKMAQDSLAPYVKAGTFHTFAGAAEILPGVTSVPARGHTPGHTAYAFVSQGQTLLLWGDIVHGYAVQFPHPEAAYEYDTDRPAAVAARKALMAAATSGHYLVGGAHLPFPGLGYVRKDAAGFAWIPLEYAPTSP